MGVDRKRFRESLHRESLLRRKPAPEGGCFSVPSYSES